VVRHFLRNRQAAGNSWSFAAVCESEMLFAAMERLMDAIHFSGRLSIVVQNGRVLKSGYEEGYFHRRKDRLLS
jgi:hypothetical protein